MKTFHIYMLASRSRRLYVGMKSDLERRVAEHKSKASAGFTSRYNIDRLVWYETVSMALADLVRKAEEHGDVDFLREGV